MSLAKVGCSREGCSACETADRVFVTCSRCNKKRYCSVGCKKADQCMGHGSCTVQALQEAAVAGPFAPSQYEQVAQLLKQHPSDNSASSPTDPCLTPAGPQTGITLGTLHALRTALAHPPADPLAPPPGLLSSHLLPTLASLVPHTTKHPEDPIPPSSILLIEAVAAALNALLGHPLHCALIGIHHSGALPPAEAMASWDSITAALTSHFQYSRWLGRVFFMPTSPSGSLVAEEAQHLWAAAGLSGSAPGSPSVLGAEVLLSAGNIRVLDILQGKASTLSISRDALCLEWHGMTGGDKVAMLLEQQAAALPHVGAAELVVLALHGSQGQACTAILKRPGTLKALALPLEALAADPLVWHHKPYIHYLGMLGHHLCDWVASVKGLPGLQQLAQHLARPTIAALDALLELDQDDHKASTTVVHACLVVMTHLAYTAHGQSCIAAAGCAPRWLELAPSWMEQPMVLEQLLLLLQVPFHTGTPYFKQLYTQEDAKAWITLAASVEHRPSLLDQQMSSNTAMDSIAELFRSVEDHSCWALLMQLVLQIGKEASEVCLSQPLISAVLDICSPPLRQPSTKPDRPHNDDMDLFLAELAGCTSISRPMLFAMLARLYTAAPERLSGMPAAALASGSQHPRVQMPGRLLGVMVVWLRLCAVEGGLPTFLEEADPEVHSTMSAVVLDAWRTLADGDLISLQFLQQHQVLQLWFQILPLLEDNEESLLVAVSLMKAMKAIKLSVVRASGDKFLLHMQAVLLQGSNIDPVLAALTRQVQTVQANGVPVLDAIDDLRGAVLFDMVATCYSTPAAMNTDAARKLLAATPVWDLFAAVALGMQVPPRSHLHMGMVMLWGALQSSLLRAGAVRQQAQAVVKRLGRGTVETIMRAPWLQHGGVGQAVCMPEVFRSVFKQDSAATAARAAAPASSNGSGSCSGSGSSTVGTSVAQTSRPPAAAAAAAGGRGGQGKGGPAKDLQADAKGTPAQGSAGSSSACGRGRPEGGTSSRGCSVCHTQPERTFLCSVCEGVRYCSRECQRADWKQHKKVCKAKTTAA